MGYYLRQRGVKFGFGKNGEGQAKNMTRWSLLLVTLSFGVRASALADASPHVPQVAKPIFRCIHRVLESGKAMQSVSLYSVDGDGFRLAVEYSFRNKRNVVVVSDIEFLIDRDGSVAETDKIPREISEDTANEGHGLEDKVGLKKKCSLATTFDNLIPEPKARAEWQIMDWPN